MNTLGLSENKTEINNTSIGNLFSCPDCQGWVSHYAESCPKCGRFFQRFQDAKTYQKGIVDGRNWIWRIAFGVILGYLGALMITFALWFVLFILFAASVANTLQNMPKR